MKTCTKCAITKEVKEFNKGSCKKDGLSYWCKECTAHWHKEWYKEHREEAAAYEKQYRKAHEEEKTQRDKKWRQEHKEQTKQYRKKNKEERTIYFKLRYEDKKEEILIRTKQYKNKKRKNDPIFRLKENMRNRFYKWLNGSKKNKKTFEYINCTKQELIEHLENLFYDNPDTGEKMTWENYGKWHIDHKDPLSSFDPTNEEDMHKAWKKENLQPLWALENIRKNNKII